MNARLLTVSRCREIGSIYLSIKVYNVSAIALRLPLTAASRWLVVPSVDGAAGPAHLEVRGRGALKMVPWLAVCALLGMEWTVTAKAGLRPAGWPAPATTGQGRAPRSTTRVAVTADDADGAADADDLATTAAATHNQGTTPNSCPADDAGARINLRPAIAAGAPNWPRGEPGAASRCADDCRPRDLAGRLGPRHGGGRNPQRTARAATPRECSAPITLFASGLRQDVVHRRPLLGGGIGDVCAAPMRCLGDNPLALRNISL